MQKNTRISWLQTKLQTHQIITSIASYLSKQHYQSTHNLPSIPIDGNRTTSKLHPPCTHETSTESEKWRYNMQLCRSLNLSHSRCLIHVWHPQCFSLQIAAIEMNDAKACSSFTSIAGCCKWISLWHWMFHFTCERTRSAHFILRRVHIFPLVKWAESQCSSSSKYWIICEFELFSLLSFYSTGLYDDDGWAWRVIWCVGLAAQKYKWKSIVIALNGIYNELWTFRRRAAWW